MTQRPVVSRVDIVGDAVDYVRTNVVPLGSTALAMTLTYGLAVTSRASTTDNIVHQITDQGAEWVARGRYGLLLTDLVLGDALPTPFFDRALALVLLFLSAAVWGFLFARAAGGRSISNVAQLLFLVTFTCLPLQAYWLQFSAQSAATGLGFLCAALSSVLAWRWVMEGGPRWMAVAAFGLALFGGLVYQSQVLLPMAGVLIAQLISLLHQEARSGTPQHRLSDSIRLVAPAIAALGVVAFVAVVGVDHDSYVADYFAWRLDDPARNLFALAAMVVAYVVGLSFHGGWVILPSVAASLFVLDVLLRRGMASRDWYPALLALIIAGTQFAIAIAIGQPLVARAMLVVPLVAASAWLLFDLLLPPTRVRSVAMAAVAIGFVLWSAVSVSRLYQVDEYVFRQDEEIASQIIVRLRDQGWGGEPVRMAIIGDREVPGIGVITSQETFGESLFNTSSGMRAGYLMQSLGYPIQSVLAQSLDPLGELSTTMSSWPVEGSVVYTNGAVLVKFGEPAGSS